MKSRLVTGRLFLRVIHLCLDRHQFHTFMKIVLEVIRMWISFNVLSLFCCSHCCDPAHHHWYINIVIWIFKCFIWYFTFSRSIDIIPIKKLFFLEKNHSCLFFLVGGGLRAIRSSLIIQSIQLPNHSKVKNKYFHSMSLMQIQKRKPQLLGVKTKVEVKWS